MRISCHLNSFILLSAILCIHLSIARTSAGEISRNLRYELPKIFDWVHYKEAFQKIYPSLRDELVRKKIFIANALKIFSHNLAFKMGQLSYYLTINTFSDNTPHEITSMYNFRVNAMHSLESDANTRNSEFDDEPQGLSLEELQQELERIIEEKEPGYEILSEELKVIMKEGEQRRQKRSLSNKQRIMRSKRNQKRFEMKINEFRTINVPKPDESFKYVKKVPSTNTDYAPIELMSQATGDVDYLNHIEPLPESQLSLLESVSGGVTFVKQQLAWLPDVTKDNDSDGQYYDANDGFHLSTNGEEIDKFGFHRVDAETTVKNEGITPKDNSSHKGFLGGLISSWLGYDDEPGLEERVYKDWRDSGCLTVPKDQKRCGSCYAFATVAMLEWSHCRSTGNLVPFSEQYMVDCGKHVELGGCDGGDMPAMGDFIVEWGVELEHNYPYLAKETVCPYHVEESKSAGYKKPKLLDLTYIRPSSVWPEVLEKVGPMLIAVSVPKDFSFYGGFVHKGHNCYDGDDGGHAMLLVGHGIEDGQEYWLLRNSYGHNWGEGGYMKIAKDAQKNCFIEADESVYQFD